MWNRFARWSRALSGSASAIASVLALVGAAGCSDARYRLGGAFATEDTSAGGSGSADAVLKVGLCSQGADFELIDNMEDANALIDFTADRAGIWFSFNDGTPSATQTPPPNAEAFTMDALDVPRGASHRAAHTYGTGFTEWGAGMGFNLRLTLAYDASSYAGIAFWMRQGRANASSALRLSIPDNDTSPLSNVCQGDLCHDDFGQDLVLTDAWQYHAVRWSDMTQRGWSGEVFPSIDASALYGVRFQSEQGGDFEFWIDDVGLLCH
jgi:hypothetical protein